MSEITLVEIAGMAVNLASMPLKRQIGKFFISWGSYNHTLDSIKNAEKDKGSLYAVRYAERLSRICSLEFAQSPKNYSESNNFRNFNDGVKKAAEDYLSRID